MDTDDFCLHAAPDAKASIRISNYLAALMDNGHFHPTQVVSDKLPALPAFFPEIALHVTRPLRWDSDHVVLFDDETRESAKEIVRCGKPVDGAWYSEVEEYEKKVLVNRV